MAVKNFISGRLKIRVTHTEDSVRDRGGYSVRICPTVKGEKCETVKVGEIPHHGRTSRHGRHISAEDPRAMLAATKAGISFASDTTSAFADYNRRGTGTLVKPVAPKRRLKRH